MNNYPVAETANTHSNLRKAVVAIQLYACLPPVPSLVGVSVQLVDEEAVEP